MSLKMASIAHSHHVTSQHTQHTIWIQNFIFNHIIRANAVCIASVIINRCINMAKWNRSSSNCLCENATQFYLSKIIYFTVTVLRLRSCAHTPESPPLPIFHFSDVEIAYTCVKHLLSRQNNITVYQRSCSMCVRAFGRYRKPKENNLKMQREKRVKCDNKCFSCCDCAQQNRIDFGRYSPPHMLMDGCMFRQSVHSTTCSLAFHKVNIQQEHQHIFQSMRFRLDIVYSFSSK